MFLLLLACSVPIQDTSQQVKLKQFLPKQVKRTQLSPHPGLTKDPLQQDIGLTPSKGTSSAAIQQLSHAAIQPFNPDCQTKRLVSPLPSHKNVPRTACGELGIRTYTVEPNSYTRHPDHLTNAIIFGILLHSSTSSLPLSQYIVYNTFAWSISLCHYQVASASKTLSKFTMFDCGSTQISQPLVQQYSLNTPDLCSNSSTIYFPPLPNQSIQVLQIPNNTPIIRTVGSSCVAKCRWLHLCLWHPLLDLKNRLQDLGWRITHVGPFSHFSFQQVLVVWDSLQFPLEMPLQWPLL